MSRQVALALVLATLWGSESLAQSAAPVAKVRYLSNFQVAPRFGDRPESAQQRRSDPAQRRTAFHPICRPSTRCTRTATYALASRLRASWIEARVTKQARVAAWLSKSLASRRFRPNQEKMRSTSQRRRSIKREAICTGSTRI